MEPLRVLIIDDEPLAREGIHHLLREDPEVVVAGECGTGPAAAAAIVDEKPDLVFLDVQMPEMNGFDVLREVGPAALPVVVFVTAYNQYALKAFEAHAADYLLKPLDQERFHEALQWAKLMVRQRRVGQLSQNLVALLNGLAPRGAGTAPTAPTNTRHLERLVVKSGGRTALVRVLEVDWIDADGDYVRIHVGKAWHLLRETMKNLETQLDPVRFVRIHRSTIVNLERVVEIQPFFRGEYVVVLQGGTTLKLSRGYRANLEARLGRGI